MADERRSGPPFKGNVAEFWEEVEATSDKKRGEAVGPFPLNPQKRTWPQGALRSVRRHERTLICGDHV